ncbi:MAG: hypothetical protein WC835_00960 [Candidatus Paceibacterota bacterium]|jgi:hypothetical protein
MKPPEKNTLFQKTILAVLVLSIVASSSFLSLPQKAEAQISIGATVPVSDWLNFPSETETSLFTGLSSSVDYTLNPLAIMIAKAVLRKMTGSIINWINTGFEGQPSFLTDPNAFFNNIAKEQTNIFIIKLVGEQTNNPYALDLAYSILNPRGNGFTLYDDMARNCQSRGGGNTCPPGLSTPYAREAYARQFIYGNVWGPSGWSNWYSLTQYDKNNIYGAYLQAERELAQRKAKAAGFAQQDLSQSGGFLSFKKCVHWVSYNAGSLDAEDNSNINTGDTIKNCDKWETQTPGKAAADYLTASITSPIRQGELAKTFMDSVGAITEAFVNQVTMMGVKSLSDAAAGVVSGGGSSSNYGSFSSQLISPTNPAFANSSTQLTQNSGLGSVEDSIKTEGDYRAAKNVVLGVLTNAEISIGTLSACYYRVIALDPNYKTLEPVVSGLTFASTTVKDVIAVKRAVINQEIASSTLISSKLGDFKQRLSSAKAGTPAFSAIYEDFLIYRNSAHSTTDVARIRATEATQAQSLIQNEITPRITACGAKETEIRNQIQQLQNNTNAG